MTTRLIVVEGKSKLDLGNNDCQIVELDDYLTHPDYFKLKGAQVINLCKDYSYLSVAYYCSLLAEARGHRVIPSVKTMLDLSSKAMYSLDADQLDKGISKAMQKILPDGAGLSFEMKVFFGQCRFEPLASLARQLFETFPSPLLSVQFSFNQQWRLSRIRPLSLARLNKEEREQFNQALHFYLKQRWRSAKKSRVARYDLAILHNPDDPQPPSNKKALQAFVKAGKQLGINVELIERKDYSALAEYDALFIRDTTRIDHYTYRFAKKAESEGMVVIDDPASILRCTNKVYLAELLRNHKVPTPQTVIMGRKDLAAAEMAIGYPMVLKVPDGAFSQGVFKVANHSELERKSTELFKSSELLLAQAFVPTEFDWRIGILNRQPLFASQYFMSKKHWQIVQYDKQGKAIEGGFKTWPIDEVPEEVVRVALKAANLIGDGLYGVDLKQGESGCFVIEINDNPNLEAGVEDVVLKDQLYQAVMEEFLRRLEQRHGR